jgi:hypothetical protein
VNRGQTNAGGLAPEAVAPPHRPNLSRRQARFLREGLARLGHRAYADYLASPRWQELRLRYARSSRPKRCAVCHDPAYQLHHRTYRRLGRERLDDLLPLCRRHHDELHAAGLPLWDGHRILRRREREGADPLAGSESPGKSLDRDPQTGSGLDDVAAVRAPEPPPVDRLDGDRVWLGYEVGDYLTSEVETLADALCGWLPLRWQTSRAGWVMLAEGGWDAGISVPTIETVTDYLICLHEVAHVAPLEEDRWVELVEGRDRDTTEGELLLEEEALCWLWAIENSSVPVPAAAVASAMARLATYEEGVELEEGPGWRRGPARRALDALCAERGVDPRPD